MNRQDIRLLAAARAGDPAAQCEAGRRYLAGSYGFPRHVRLGLEYLTHPAVRSLPASHRAVAELLSLEELIVHDQRFSLEAAVVEGGAEAIQAKLGAWTAICGIRYESGVRPLQSAATRGSQIAKSALNARKADGEVLAEYLQSTGADGKGGYQRVLALLAGTLLEAQDLQSLVRCVGAALHLSITPTRELADLVLKTFELAERLDQEVRGLSVDSVQSCLELKCGPGDYSAAFTLGRALCGISRGRMPYTSLVRSTNYRRGAAMLLRAAENGCSTAWSHLYELHRGGGALGNPQMALFFLEKAARNGSVVAQRRLGISILREAVTSSQQEEGMSWLVKAARSGDGAAAEVATTFVLRAEGSDHEADAALEALRSTAPRLAARLTIARDFGLTKREALTIDLSKGLRPWGVLIEQDASHDQRRPQGSRAVPAICDGVVARLAVITQYFTEDAPPNKAASEDLRQRFDATRYALKKGHFDEKLFFAVARTATLDTLRVGTKWAVRFRDIISAAMGGGLCETPPQLVELRPSIATREKKQPVAGRAAHRVADARG
jgi:TPR repeat protein